MMPKPTEHQLGFVKHLQAYATQENRGALAALRRGLGKAPGTVSEMFPYVLPFVSGMMEYDQDPYFLIAALFGAHPSQTDKGNMGDTFRGVGVSRGDDTSTERRFVALLNAHADDLPDHLRHAIGLARGADVPVNYAQLLRDLQYWTHPDAFIQREWAEAFWRRVGEQAEGASTDTAAQVAD
jgi:CRISPR system Cascade subunit CasB